MGYDQSTVSSTQPDDCLTHWLVTTPATRLGVWKCSAVPSGWSEPRTQDWSMLSFSHDGMYVVETAHQRSAIDPNTILLINAGQEYRTTRVPGRTPSGTSIAIRQDVLETLAGSA